MLLVVNCMRHPQLADSLDRILADRLASASRPSEFRRLDDLPAIENPAHYDRLIITGSEASCLDSNPWDQPLETLADHFIQRNRPVMGICYGHQFLARMLAGRDCIRRSPSPEFGWADIRLGSSPLFRGITHPVCAVSHYDEVQGLSNGFRILAASANCAIHSFRYGDRPVWGIQFHPEYDPETSREVLDDIARTDPDFSGGAVDDRRPTSDLDQNRRFFTNFMELE